MPRPTEAEDAGAGAQQCSILPVRNNARIVESIRPLGELIAK